MMNMMMLWFVLGAISKHVGMPDFIHAVCWVMFGFNTLMCLGEVIRMGSEEEDEESEGRGVSQ